MTLICMFPGQSSLTPTMLAEAAERWPDTTAETLARAERRLGERLQPWLRRVEPTSNRDVQLAVFLTSHVHMLAEAPSGAVASLGLSLGEYNHLVHIDALSFDDAVELVALRGAAYDRGPRGCMAAVFPLAYDELAPLVEEARARGVVEIANRNSPTQHVIAGDVDAVEHAIDLIERETFATVRRLAGTIPMHSSSFRVVADAFRPVLERAPWRRPRLAYRPNVDAAALASPDGATIAACLHRHVCEPVRWRESIERVLADHPEAILIEIGPARVLTNLLRKPWHAAERRVARDAPRKQAATTHGEAARGS
jgi:[acyl-carrier-protein] S-malonyltransferase